MIEIIMGLILLVVMARRAVGRGGKRSYYYGYRKLPFNTDVAGGTLSADDVTVTVIGNVMTEARRVLSIMVSIAMEGLANTDGPIEVGVAHSDYTAAEIEEALEAGGAWDEGDLVAQEQAKRMVRRIGVLTEQETALNEGQPIKVRLNWLVATGDTLQFWLWNRGIQLTTGMEIAFTGVLHTVRR